jgi:hypothetical protein
MKEGSAAFNWPPHLRRSDADACQFPAPSDAFSGPIPRTNHGQMINGLVAAPGDQAVYLGLLGRGGRI